MEQLASGADVTSLSLLGRAKSQDPQAWRRLVQLYSPLIFFWARQSGCGEHDAADVVQDVWTSVSSALERFHRDATSGTFRGWLWTITRNKLLDLARKPSIASAVGGTDAQCAIQNVPEAEPPDESGHESNALLQRVLELLHSQFEKHVWQAFWEVAVNGRSATDVGEQLGMDANAVRQAKFRVLNRLRREFSELDESFAGIGLLA